MAGGLRLRLCRKSSVAADAHVVGHSRRQEVVPMQALGEQHTGHATKRVGAQLPLREMSAVLLGMSG